MKKFDLFLILIVVTLLAACGSAPAEDIEINERFSGNGAMSGSRIITDTETGCHYVFHKDGYAGGMTPLYNEDGEIDCGIKEGEKE